MDSPLETLERNVALGYWFVAQWDPFQVLEL